LTPNNLTVFDQYGAITDSRMDFLVTCLHKLAARYCLKTALDVGCGVGLFSDRLNALGLNVKAVDARVDNIMEAQQRYPHIPFSVHDVEQEDILGLGQFDFVLCFGLLYHLESPFLAIRHLRALTAGILLIESMIAPCRSPGAVLIDEGHLEDQSIHYVAFVPSEAGYVKMLYRSGFSGVYKPHDLPDHSHFRESLTSRRQRTILACTDLSLSSLAYDLVPEPSTPDPWRKKGGTQLQRLTHFLGKPFGDKLLTLKRIMDRREPPS